MGLARPLIQEKADLNCTPYNGIQENNLVFSPQDDNAHVHKVYTIYCILYYLLKYSIAVTDFRDVQSFLSTIYIQCIFRHILV